MGTGTWRSLGIYQLVFMTARPEPRAPFSSRPRWFRPRAPFKYLNIQVGDVQRVLLDELPARLDGVAHEHREHRVGADGILHRDLEERARLGVHRGVRELFRVHFAEAFVPLKRGARLRVFEGGP